MKKNANIKACNYTVFLYLLHVLAVCPVVYLVTMDTLFSLLTLS
jgi:hypothetical protein